MEVYRRAGGKARTRGRGAPWDLHLMICAMLHTPIAERKGTAYHFAWETENVLDWLFPNGWPNRARDWDQFIEALWRLRQLSAIHVEGMDVLVPLVEAMPPATRDAPYVLFTTRIPGAMARGAEQDFPTLCRYRLDNAPVYRAYISALDFMHRSAKNGQPQTRLIGEVLTAADGTVRRHRGGRPRRSMERFVENEQAKFVRGLSKRQLAELIGLDPENRGNRADALEAFEQLEADGILELHREGRGHRERFFLFGRNQAVDAAQRPD